MAPVHAPARNPESRPIGLRAGGTSWARRMLVPGAIVAGLLVSAASAGPPRQPPDSVDVETPEYRVTEPVTGQAERWVYEFSWSRFLKVATVEVTAGERIEAGDSRTIGVFIRASSARILDWLWRYRMNADGVVNLAPYRPGSFEVRESINRAPKTNRVEFDGNGGVHTYRKKEGRVREFEFATHNTFDMVSALYLVMNQDLTVGESYQVDALAGNVRYLVTLEVVDTETIRVANGEHAALKLRVRTEDLTDPPDNARHTHTDLWVSAERPRRMLQAVSNLWLGTIRGRLVSIERPTAWPAMPPEVELGIDARWLATTEAADSDLTDDDHVPEIERGARERETAMP